MISEEHLEHWLSEMEYALNGIRNELNKKSYAKEVGLMINTDYLSLEYLREKEATLKRLIYDIKWDTEHDGVSTLEIIHDR